MAWGAAATGTPAATGSTGQGLSLMQESLAEITLARLPLVVLNMARGQGDYWQATRGGGHGDYRHIVLAPGDVAEAVELIQLGVRPGRDVAQPGARLRRLLPGPHGPVGVDSAPSTSAPSARPWALTGASGGPGHAKLVSFLGPAKQRDDVGYDLSTHYAACAEHTAADARAASSPRGRVPASPKTPRSSSWLSGRPGATSASAVRSLRAEGVAVGCVPARHPGAVPHRGDRRRRRAGPRPWPSTRSTPGQMFDDVRLAVLGAAPVHFIGRLSMDPLGLRHRPRPRRRHALAGASCDEVERHQHDRALADVPLPPTGPPTGPAHVVDDFTPPLIDVGRAPPVPRLRGAHRRAWRWR